MLFLDLLQESKTCWGYTKKQLIQFSKRDIPDVRNLIHKHLKIVKERYHGGYLKDIEDVINSKFPPIVGMEKS